MKNVTTIHTKEWYLEDSERWQVVGIDSSVLGEDSWLWVKNLQERFPDKSHIFRTREFLVSNDKLTSFLETEGHRSDNV